MNREERVKAAHAILAAYNRVNITDEEIRNMWQNYVKKAKEDSQTSSKQSVQTVDEIWRNIYDNQ